MKVLVTGAGSLLLGGVARQLAERGDEVVCFQRRESASTHQNITMFAGDIRDRTKRLAKKQMQQNQISVTMD